MTRELQQNDVLALQQLAGSRKETSLLRACTKKSINRVSVVRAYHEVLLHLMAWPASKEIYRLARMEMERLVELIRKRKGWQEELSGNGIAHTSLSCQYSLELLKRLALRFPAMLSIGEMDISPQDFGIWLLAFLPEAEFERTTASFRSSIAKWEILAGTAHSGEQLHKLLQQMEGREISPRLQEILFDKLGLFVNLEFSDPTQSRSLLKIHWADTTTYPRTPRITHPMKFISKALPLPEKLIAAQKEHLLDVAQLSLTMYRRETDPVSNAGPGQVQCFEVEKGLKVALFFMKPGFRQSLESYIGYTVFSNGIPVAYGGGWLWGGRCTIGIHLYGPFRGGPSSRVWMQVLRVYRQWLGVERFVVKPYQFGKGNPEGIRSGAFWFYYKIGFRPADPGLAAEAEREWKKKEKDKKYRSPAAILRKFTGSFMEWQLDPPARTNRIDAALVSDGISGEILGRFGGDRKKAEQAALRFMKKDLGTNPGPNGKIGEKQAFLNWGILLSLLPGVADWKASEKKAMVRMIRSKGSGNEADFVQSLQKHQAFWHSLENWFVV